MWASPAVVSKALTMRRHWWLALSLVCLCPVAAQAVDPDRRISQYTHAAWRIQDGFFRGSPYAIAQTQDGYLWVGTRSELLRFDGVRFVPWSAERGQRLPTSHVYGLLGARDGSLWIATSGGLSRWKNQTLTNYPGPIGGVFSILEDHSGTIWFGQSTVASPEPLCRVVGASKQCLGVADGVPRFNMADALLEDAQGNIWIGGDKALVRWRPGSQSVYRPHGLETNSATGIAGLASTVDGKIWVGINRTGPGLGLQQIVNGQWSAFKTRDLDSSTWAINALFIDREGTLWVGTDDRGLYRLRDGVVDHVDRASGLSANGVQQIFEDREGNIWVATNQGIDRFSDTPVVSFTDNEGLCSAEVVSVLAARDGGVWVGGAGGISRVRDGRVWCFHGGKELPGDQVTSLLEDHLGRLWVGIDDALWMYDHGTPRRIAKPDGRPIGFVTSLAEDAEQNVWVVANGPPRTVMRIQDFTVREEHGDAHMPRRVAVDPTGGIWLGLLNGDLAHYRDGQLSTYRSAQDAAAVLEQLLPQPDGSILAATSYGLIGWQDGRHLSLTEKNGLPCAEVNGIAFDNDANLWMWMSCGLGELTAAELQAWKRDPTVTVSIRTVDVLDGVRTGSAAFLAATRSLDGRLWFANGQMVQMLDPTRLRRNAAPPPVHIEQVIADRQVYPAAGVLQIPSLTRDLEIDYVGLNFAVPQKVRFRYRLEGRDTNWQEPGARRQAFYSDLRPGRYRFRLTASTDDRRWNEREAALDFVIAPAWYQTYAFLGLCIVTGGVTLWAIYRLRIYQLARALNVRFDERLAERTRVARDIHDTLLQTVQGSKLVADDALERPDDIVEMRQAMEQVSQWLGQAGREGRATVNALRASTTEQNDLAEAFRRAIEDCRRQSSMKASLSVTGEPREMHPVVRDEVYRIGYEAIRNACTHSGGSRLEVGLQYAHDLALRVADDGVGIDSKVAKTGKDGHFGLQGMRERAARIGATITIASTATTGSEMVLVVPGHAIFRKRTTTLFHAFLARSRKTTSTKI